MPRRFFSITLLSLALATAGCMRTEPILDIHNELIPAQVNGLSRDQVGRAVAEGVTKAQWRIDQTQPGQLRATLDVRAHSATVDVSWTAQSFSITFVRAVNLKEHEGQIHHNYNAWIEQLEQHINNALLHASDTGAAAPAAVAAMTPPAATATVTDAPPASAPPRAADSAEFTCPAPGSQIEFKRGITRVFGIGDGLYCPYAVAGQQQRQATTFGVYSRDGALALARLWPLKVGNKVTFAAPSGPTVYQEQFRVARRATVTVPAGTFDAFIIDWSSYSTSQTNPYSETAEFWYAPQVSYVVKVERRLVSGTYGRLTDDEAVRITR